MGSLDIRPYHEEDSAFLHEIDRLTWSPNNSPGSGPSDDFDEYRSRLNRRTILVAELNGRVCGYIGMGPPTPLPSNDHVAVIDIAVHPQFQRRGVATALLQAMEEWAMTNGKRKLALRVLATNPGAKVLYRRLGFVEERRLRGEFQIGGKFVDDVLMAKWLE